MVHCFHLAGFPKGLISAITGKGSEIGDFLTMHPTVNCIRYWFSVAALSRRWRCEVHHTYRRIISGVLESNVAHGVFNSERREHFTLYSSNWRMF